jgi:hypothetical protein
MIPLNAGADGAALDRNPFEIEAERGRSTSPHRAAIPRSISGIVRASPGARLDDVGQ